MLSATLLIAFLAGGGAATADLPMPYESQGACPFECCTYRAWTVESETSALADRKDDAPIVFRVRRGQRVVGVTGVVVVTKPGLAVVKAAATLGEGLRSVTVRRGDRILVLHPLGEGYWKLWVRGRHIEEQIADIDDGCENSDREPVPCIVQITKHPDYVWWAKIRSRGRIGWTKELDRFSDIDACG